MGNQPSGTEPPRATAGPAPDERLRAVVERACAGGELRLPGFEEVLRALERPGLALRGTPLGRRMFERVAGARQRAGQEELLRELGELLAMGREQRMVYSFELYDPQGSGQIAKRAFVALLGEATAAAVRLLAEGQGLPAPDAAALLAAATAVFEAEFDRYDLAGRGAWTAQEFKSWCALSKREGVIAELGETRVQVPLHFANELWTRG